MKRGKRGRIRIIDIIRSIRKVMPPPVRVEQVRKYSRKDKSWKNGE